MNLEKLMKTPKDYLMAMLIGLTLVAALRPQDHIGLFNAGISIATALVIDGMIAMMYKSKKKFPDGGIITALIVADVLSNSTPWYIIAATTAVALMSKHIIKSGRKPIFNPAAFGLLFAIYIFSTGQSWWGSLALLPTWLIPVMIIPGIVISIKVNKFPQVASFLGVYFALMLLMAISHLGLPYDTPADALRIPFVNSALFLAFFMLTDPPTTPATYPKQIVFGSLVAIIGSVIFANYGGLAYLLIGLLMGNLINFTLMRARQNKLSEVTIE